MTAFKEDNDTKAVKLLVQHFFDAVNAADTKALQSHFLPTASLAIIRQDPPAAPDSVLDRALAESKVTVLIRTTIEAFIKMIEDGERRRKGKPGPKLHEWPLLEETEVRFDGLFGTAWSPFKVTFDEKLHHYGTMVFSVGYTSTPGGDGPHDKEWKIIGLEQSYRRTPGWEGQATSFM